MNVGESYVSSFLEISLKFGSNVSKFFSQYLNIYGSQHLWDQSSTTLVSNVSNHLFIRLQNIETFTFSWDYANKHVSVDPPKLVEIFIDYILRIFFIFLSEEPENSQKPLLGSAKLQIFLT